MFGKGSRENGNGIAVVERNGSGRGLMALSTSRVRRDHVDTVTLRRVHQQEAAARAATESEADADASELIADRMATGEAVASKYEVSLEAIRRLLEEMASAQHLNNAQKMIYGDLIRTHRASMIAMMQRHLNNHHEIETGVDFDIAQVEAEFEKPIDGRGAHAKNQNRDPQGKFNPSNGRQPFDPSKD